VGASRAAGGLVPLGSGCSVAPPGIASSCSLALPGRRWLATLAWTTWGRRRVVGSVGLIADLDPSRHFVVLMLLPAALV
jgi:hypothetical protein